MARRPIANRIVEEARLREEQREISERTPHEGTGAALRYAQYYDRLYSNKRRRARYRRFNRGRSKTPTSVGAHTASLAKLKSSGMSVKGKNRASSPTGRIQLIAINGGGTIDSKGISKGTNTTLSFRFKVKETMKGGRKNKKTGGEKNPSQAQRTGYPSPEAATFAKGFYYPSITFYKQEQLHAPRKTDLEQRIYRIRANNEKKNEWFWAKVPNFDRDIVTVRCQCRDYYFMWWYWNHVNFAAHTVPYMMPTYYRKTKRWHETDNPGGLKQRNPDGKAGLCKHSYPVL